MDKRFTAVRVLVVSVLAVYLLLGALSTGGVALPIGVLLLVLILWFSLYRFRHKGLGNQELVTKMHADLKGTLERIEERMAQEEARRRAAEEHEERVRVEREKRRVEGERRKASITARDPAVSWYAEMIENKVREGERTTQGFEGHRIMLRYGSSTFANPGSSYPSPSTDDLRAGRRVRSGDRRSLYHNASLNSSLHVAKYALRFSEAPDHS